MHKTCCITIIVLPIATYFLIHTDIIYSCTETENKSHIESPATVDGATGRVCDDEVDQSARDFGSSPPSVLPSETLQVIYSLNTGITNKHIRYHIITVHILIKCFSLVRYSNRCYST